MSKFEIRCIIKVEKNVGASGLPVAAPSSSFKHWGLVLEIFNVEKGTTREKLLEAGDCGGKLRAELPKDYEDYEEEWKQDPGFAEEEIPVKEPVACTLEDINQFIEKFNATKREYSLIFANCQEFVRELLTYLRIENIWTLTGIKSYAVKAATCSATSSVSLARPALESICKSMLTAGLGGDALISQALKSISFVGSSGIDYLNGALQTQAGKLLAENAKEQGKQLILSASGELAERLMQGMQGSITWWQLLQIPVELGTKILLESEWFKTVMKEELGFNITDDHAYLVSKMASLTTASVVGGVVTGGWGIIGAVVLWFAAEFVSFAMRLLAGYVSSWFTEDGSDYFEQYLGPSKTMTLITWILGDDPQEEIFEYMKRYMLSTKNKNKLA